MNYKELILSTAFVDTPGHESYFIDGEGRPRYVFLAEKPRFMFSPIVSLKTPAGRAVFFKDMVSGTVIVPGFYKGHMSNSGKMRRICVEPVNPDIREYLRIYLKHIKYGEKFHFWEDHDF